MVQAHFAGSFTICATLSTSLEWLSENECAQTWLSHVKLKWKRRHSPSAIIAATYIYLFRQRPPAATNFQLQTTVTTTTSPQRLRITTPQHVNHDVSLTSTYRYQVYALWKCHDDHVTRRADTRIACGRTRITQISASKHPTASLSGYTNVSSYLKCTSAMLCGCRLPMVL